MKKKTIFVLTVASLLTVGIVGSYSYADKATKYKIDKATVTSHVPASDPNGKAVGFAQVHYKDNHNIDKSKLKKPEQLTGFSTDSDLASLNASRVMLQVMTYEQYYELGTSAGIAHDIDPNRLVWVNQVDYPNGARIANQDIPKAVVTTVYDAETGDLIESSVQSKDPHGMDSLKKAHSNDSSNPASKLYCHL